VIAGIFLRYEAMKQVAKGPATRLRLSLRAVWLRAGSKVAQHRNHWEISAGSVGCQISKRKEHPGQIEQAKDFPVRPIGSAPARRS
jgi:hypothetical protein